jgi:hypothetical protein
VAEIQSSLLEKRKKIAWSIAASTCIKTKEDPLAIYNRILARYEQADKEGQSVLDESNKTQ